MTSLNSRPRQLDGPAIARAGRRKAARSIRKALEEVLALLTDRPRRRDLLIEHLHLIQDHYGPSLGRASCGAGAGDEARAHRGLRGRDLLRPFRCGEGRRDAAAAGHGARLRFAYPARWPAPRQLLAELPKKLGPGRARRARALHGRLRSRAGLRRRPCAGDAGRYGESRRGRGKASACARLSRRRRLRRLCEGRRLRTAEVLPRRQAHARRAHQDRQRCRFARSRRRRLSDRTQMVAGSRRTGAAPVRGQLRRGRARHVQGPLLSRARSAPLHRRHADRRLGRRGRRHLSLCPRRISRSDPSSARRDRQGRGSRAFRTTPRSICAAAPALTSAAKNPR